MSDGDRLNELLGMINAITADDEIEDKEIFSLNKWLNNNSDLLDTLPFDAINTKIKAIISDGYVSNEEHDELLSALKQIT